MRIDPLNQLLCAAVSTLAGIGLGLLYDVFRTVRRRMQGRTVTVITDILFCMAVCLAIFLVGYTFGKGRTRGHMAAGACLGAAVYFLLLSTAVLRLLALLAALVRRAAITALLPVKLFLNLLKKITIFLKNAFYYKRKWYTINWVSNVSMQENRQIAYRALRGQKNETEKGRYYY